MSFIVGFLRRVLGKPPVVVFIVLVLGSWLIGYGIIYSTLTANLHGNYIRFKVSYLEIEFPKNWFAYSWELGNETSGRSYSAFFAPTDLYVVTLLRIYDEVATRKFLEENNLTDPFSVAIYEANRVYDWSLQSNKNATFHSLENGTVFVSDHEADYTEFRINGGFEQDQSFYNLTCIYTSWVDQQKLFEIAFWGKEEDWRQTYDIFEVILETVKA